MACSPAVRGRPSPHARFHCCHWTAELSPNSHALPEADKLLASVISGDKDDRVRNTAIRAAEVRWPARGDSSFRPATDPLVATLVTAATSDPSETVRAGAIGLLRSPLDTVPELHATLSSIASTDARPGVRKLAADALAQSR